jgi:hypothetical protein
MTCFWPEGLPVEVSADPLGTPLRFTWAEQLHLVDQVARRWRLDEEWWYVRIWREYFKLTTQTGLLVVLFHDLLTDQWYLQRLYD